MPPSKRPGFRSSLLALVLGSTLFAAPAAAHHFTLVGSTPTLGPAARSVVRLRWIYVSTGYGLEIFNVSNPAAPVALGTVGSVGGAYDIVFGGGQYIYLAGNNYGVWIIDVANPNSPFLAGTMAPGSVGGKAFGVEVAGNLLFVLSGDGGMRIFDIASTPTSPTLVGTYAPIGVYHNDGVAFGSSIVVADGVKGPTVFDVSVPTTPVLVADTNNTALSFDVALVEDLLVSVSVPFPAIETFDLAPPIVDPLLALDSESTGPGTFYLDVDVAREGSGVRYAYVASVYGGCEIWRVELPTDIVYTQTVATATGASGVTYSRGFLFVGANTGGLQIYHR